MDGRSICRCKISNRNLATFSLWPQPLYSCPDAIILSFDLVSHPAASIHKTAYALKSCIHVNDIFNMSSKDHILTRLSRLRTQKPRNLLKR